MCIVYVVENDARIRSLLERIQESSLGTNFLKEFKHCARPHEAMDTQ